MTPTSMGPASARRLIQATIAAAVLAAIILFTIVLPVEYGIDPLRTGQALGLLRPADALDPSPVAAAGGGETMTPEVAGPVARFGVPYRTDRTVFELGPYEYLEYKYHLAQGASLLYSWEASALLIHDLHGAPDAGERDAEVSHDKVNRVRASGSLVAPFTGMHGWYWENPGGSPVTIRLTSAGFYTTALETRSNRTRRTHEVEPAPLPPATGAR